MIYIYKDKYIYIILRVVLRGSNLHFLQEASGP